MHFDLLLTTLLVLILISWKCTSLEWQVCARHKCIAGMAGMGKTQVLKSLVEFFQQKSKSHHLLIVAPTGSAAALLKGLTYHSAFGINSDSSPSSNIQLAQVKSRLEGVDYIFLDEVSMLSCHDLYLISARLACVMNNLDTPFGGLNMIFAGNFSQLPPVIGQEHPSLYSCTIGRNTTSLRDQEASIRKPCGIKSPPLIYSVKTCVSVLDRRWC